MIRTYLYKLFRSMSFMIAVIGVALVCLTRFASYMRTSSVCGEIELLIGFDTLRKVIAVFGALPFAANFSNEWNSNSANMYITRCGTVKYAVSNAAVTFLSAFITVFAGIMIYAVGISFVMPVTTSSKVPYAPYGIFLENNLPYLYIAVQVAVFAISCAMWCVMGLMLSAFFPNKYVAVCAPFAASYIVERLTIGLPYEFDLWRISVSSPVFRDPLTMFSYSVAIFTALAAICTVVFTLRVKRMVQGGKN